MQNLGGKRSKKCKTRGAPVGRSIRFRPHTLFKLQIYRAAHAAGAPLARTLRRPPIGPDVLAIRWEVGSSVKIQNEVHMPRPKRRKAAKRELVAPRGDKRFVRRDDQGQFSESDDTGRSLRKDVKRRAKTRVASGQGDRGDRKKRSRKS